MPPLAVSDVAAVAAAVVLAAVGGEFFLRGILGIAGWLRLPKLLVAMTLAAFATSSPELTVSVVAAFGGRPEIGLGDSLGSNVVNIALIFGLALLFGPIRATRKELGRNFVLALVVPLLTFAFAADGMISRLEGGLLLLVFAGWMGLQVHAGKAARTVSPPAENSTRHGVALVLGLAGLAALIVAGRLFVIGASGIAATFGVSAYVIGATVVAIGTSLPELVTVLTARLRGHDEVGVGTLLGSNLFNGLAVIGTAASIHPIRAPLVELAVAIGFGLFSLLLILPSRAGVIARARGVALLAVYAAFLWATLAAAHAVM